MLLINLYPVIYAGWQSLRDGSLIDAGDFVGLQNYADVLTDPTFWAAARFTVVFTLVGVFGSWFVGLALALLLKTRFPVKNTFKLLLLLPWVVPVVVSATAWNWLVATPQSPLPILAEALGLGNVLFLADPLLAKITVCVFKVWISFPFMMMMMAAALESVDNNVYEAAKVDGASKWNDTHEHHLADDLAIDLHQLDPDDHLLRERLPHDLPADRRRTGECHADAGRAFLRHGVPELPDRPRCGDRLPDDSRPDRDLRRLVPANQEGADPMTTVEISESHDATDAHLGAEPTKAEPEPRGSWGKFVLVLVITAVVLIPVLAVVVLSLQPSLGSTSTATFTLENFVNIFSQTDVLIWLRNSMVTTLATVLVSVAVAAPAGYVLSRGRSRLISGFSLVLFIVQALPFVTAVIPLFILFANLGLVDTLTGITIIFVGFTMSVAIWMMAAYYDSIPINLEEAAWMDGCSVFGGFLRVVLRNSLPGILSTAIFAFLVAWNDYLVPLVFLRSSEKFTFPVGLQSFFQQNSTNWGLVMAVAVMMMLPPVILFAALNRYFSVGGIGGSLAGA